MSFQNIKFNYDKVELKSIEIDGEFYSVKKIKIIDAVKQNKIDIVKRYIEKGGDLENQDDENSMTLLHWSCFFNHEEITLMLIEAGANIHALTTKKKTPLHYSKSVRVVQLLIEKGADVNALDSNHNSPLYDARHNSGIVNILIDAGAKYNEYMSDTVQKYINSKKTVEIFKSLDNTKVYFKNHQVTKDHLKTAFALEDKSILEYLMTL